MHVERDLRKTPVFAELESYAKAWLLPGSGLVRDAVDLAVSPDGAWLAFSGAIVDKLEGAPTTRLCLLEMATGALKVVSFGPHTDRAPAWSPDRRHIAFLSDRELAGQFQPYLLDLESGAARVLPRPTGWVEYIHFSPDGRYLLLGVAGLGADLAGAQGALASPAATESLPAWIPRVESGDEAYRWRSLSLIELATLQLRHLTPAKFNPWEAVWSSTDSIACIASDRPDEEAWYTASLHHVDVASGAAIKVYSPQRTSPERQLGWLSGAPIGRGVAVVEAVCSDRGIVAGELLIVDAGGRLTRCDTRGVDVTSTRWIDGSTVLYAGLRGLETVVASYDIVNAGATEHYRSEPCSVGAPWYPDAVPVGSRRGEFVAVEQGFLQAPRLVHGSSGGLRALRSFEVSSPGASLDGLAAQPVRWRAPDGLEIQGWLLLPSGSGPHPVVLQVHGGPVWCYRPRYLGSGGNWLALLRRGYALFLPNPRGSSGRGQEFAAKVFGDMGGADTYDYLSGIDHLVAQGVADPTRIGVTGGSYGGYIASWLITQDSRFAASIPVAPVTDWVSEHLTCHIPHFCAQFLADTLTNAGGKYFTRSPVMYANKVRTPTLNVCGALDRITPPGQALEFHQALRLHGVESVLVTYPQEGHGVRNFPAVFDFGARVIEWFERFMPGHPPQ